MEIQEQEQEPSPEPTDCTDLQKTVEVTLAQLRYSETLAGEPFDPESPIPVDYLCCDEIGEAPTDQMEFSTENCLGNGSSEVSSWSSNQDSISISVSRTKLTGVGAGLMNIGNTCFINAVLQCFTHTVPLLEGLRSSRHLTPCDRLLEGFCVLCSLRDHVRHSLTTQSESISPAVFFQNLNFFSSSFIKYSQEDAHEFLQCFLDRLDSCFLDSKTDSSSDENLVKKVFGGSLISKLECCNCGYSSETPEPLIDLSLGIEDVDSLTEALESFTKEEKIEDSEPKFQCENCKKEVDVVKRLAVDEAPTVAVFHLKRFKVNESYVEKIDNHVRFPLELDLRSYTIDAADDDKIRLEYDLYGIVVHSGGSIASGHYFSFIRTSSDKWHRLDDDLVNEVSEEEVLSQNAYILFYAKRGIPWFSSFIEAEQMFLDPETRTESPKSVLDNIENVRAVSSNINALVSPGAAVCSVIAESVNADNCTVMPLGEIDRPQEDEKISLDELFHPLTPPRPPTPDVFSLESPESSYQIQIPRDHLKSEARLSRKRLMMNSPADDSEKKEAVRYLTRSMPSSRGSKLMEAIFRPQSEGAAKKKRKLGSPCKRVSPVNGRHKSGHASVPHPVVEFLR